MLEYDIVIVGGGPAGLAAAVAARRAGTEKILILERDRELGGILNQCIHNGFGLHTFQEELTGPEYAARFIAQVKELEIEYRLCTMVMEISPGKVVTAMSREDGMYQIQAKAVILAMGCRERPRGALNIPGYRPAGIYSAGTAQRLVNMEGFLPGRKVVILGSGDIGLIMARRMTLEGAEVKVVAELMPYSGGLKRNIVQCLDDYGIPLKLSHTVVDIKGKERVEGVTLAEVDEQNRPIPGTEEFYECDTLLLSVGLIPENELSGQMGVELSRVTSGPVVNESLETNMEGVFACGNVLHVHDLVDFVSEEAATAGKNAACYVKNLKKSMKNVSNYDESSGDEEKRNTACESAQNTVVGAETIQICPESGVRYTVPSVIRLNHMEEEQVIRFRVGSVYKNNFIRVYLDGTQIFSRKRPVMAPGEMEQVTLKKKQLIEAIQKFERINGTAEDVQDKNGTHQMVICVES
jgi:NADPH-dependent 2,4-dienoyl-CoA reductase/sulfur reductase-like enzyme